MTMSSFSEILEYFSACSATSDYFQTSDCLRNDLLTLACQKSIMNQQFEN